MQTINNKSIANLDEFYVEIDSSHRFLAAARRFVAARRAAIESWARHAPKKVSMRFAHAEKLAAVSVLDEVVKLVESAEAAV